MTTRRLLPLHEITQADRPFVGGKAAGLAELIHAGVPVPPGFVITALATHNPRAPMPEPLRDELISQLNGGPDQRYAVRSSAAHEDGATRSYAGHYATFLNVLPEDVPAAVSRCWASLTAVEGAYEATSDRIAVVVQQMARPESSGVAFSAVSRSDGTQAMGIEAVYGLGEALVSGLLTPQRFTLSRKNGQLLGQTLTRQPLMLHPGVDGPERLYGDTVPFRNHTLQVIREQRGSRTLAVTLPPDLATSRCLPLEALGALHHALIAAEQHFRQPVDAEWVWTGAALLLVQTRPVTAPVAWPDHLSEPGHTDHLTGDLHGDRQGLGAAPGQASGPARRLEPGDTGDTLQAGEVLLAHQTFPKWFFAMRRAAAIVTETGGMLSHAAIVARELGVPCVAGVNDLPDWPDGTVLHVNADAGTVSSDPPEEVPAEAPEPAEVDWHTRSINPAAALFETLEASLRRPDAPIPGLFSVSLADPGVPLSPEEHRWLHAARQLSRPPS